jgi:hypothetical protein
MTYPKKDNTKDPLPDGAKPEPLACGEVVLDGQEVLLKCIKMKSASSELKKYFIGYFKAFGMAPVSPTITIFKLREEDAYDFEEDPDADAVEAAETIDEPETDAPDTAPLAPDAAAAPSTDKAAAGEQPERSPDPATSNAAEADVAEPAAPEPAATADRIDPRALPPAPESEDDEATTKVKDQARELLALALESAAKAGITAGAAHAKIWNILKPVLAVPPARRDAMLDALRAKITAEFAKPEKLASLLGAHAGDDAGAASGTADPAPASTAPPISLVKLGKARIGWQTDRLHAVAEIERLKSALAEEFGADADQATALQGALGRLDGLINLLNDKLEIQLDSLLDENYQSRRAALSQQVKVTLDGAVKALLADPVMLAIDGNEVLPDMLVMASLRERMTELAGVLA